MAIHIITGVSGSGKSDLSRKVFSPEQKLITTTSRTPRNGEIDGVDYYFVQQERFLELIDKEAFIEYNAFSKGYYGLTKEEFQSKTKKGDVYIILDHNGAKRYKNFFPESVLIFLDVNKEESIANMRDRGDGENDIQERLNKYEIESAIKEFSDHIIVNRRGKMDETIAALRSIVKTSI